MSDVSARVNYPRVSSVTYTHVGCCRWLTIYISDVGFSDVPSVFLMDGSMVSIDFYCFPLGFFLYFVDEFLSETALKLL